MQTWLAGPGFLGTHAPLSSDLSLTLILFTAVLFTIGWRLAVGQHFVVHRWIQTSAAVLNAIVVLSWMVTSFLGNILPALPGKLLQNPFGVTTVHAAVGLLGTLLGLFVVLRGNELVPGALKFENYKLFMRPAYALYMLATLLGVTVYIATYG